MITDYMTEFGYGFYFTILKCDFDLDNIDKYTINCMIEQILAETNGYLDIEGEEDEMVSRSI